MVARVDSMGQAPSCVHPATLATRIASSAGWTAESRTVIDPTSLVVTDTNKTMEDAPFPGDRTYCQGGPMYPPSEVSPPAASADPLLFRDERTLEWEIGAPSSSKRFHLYRGDLAVLRSGHGPDCLIAGLTTNTAADGEIPEAGATFFYVVAGENDAGRGTLGNATDGSERQPARSCN